MRWIDLSAHEAQLIVAEDRQTRKRRLVLYGSGIDREAHALGFSYDQGSGLWVRADLSIDIPAFREQFPLLSVRDMSTQAVVKRSGPAPTNRTENTGQTAHPDNGRGRQQANSSNRPDAPRAWYLGRNRQRQEVYEDENGHRFIRERAGRRIDDDGERAPDLFLRAPDEDSLVRCANALLQQVADGVNLRATDIQRFKRIVGAWSENRVQMALEGAMARRVAVAEGHTMRDAFGQAVRLHEGFVETARGEVRPPSAPLPLAIALQRLAGTEDDVAGQRLVLAHAGAGALLSHISNRADLSIYVDREQDLPHARATAQLVGIPSNRVTQGDPDYAATDIVVSAPEPMHLEAPVTLGDGVTVTRGDYAEIARSLEQRTEDGRTIVLVRGPRAAEENDEAERFRAWVGRHYAIEGTADVDPALCGGAPGDAPLRAIVIGSRRPEPMAEAPEPAMRRRDIHDSNAIWTWVSEVVRARAKIAEWHAEQRGQTLDAGEESEEQAAESQHNQFQAPYRAASTVGTATSMVPRNLEGAHNQALDRFARQQGGDIDGFVANYLGFQRDELNERFSPEQIDALALAINADERGRGFLNADDTGLGKGRFMAGLALKGLLQGKKVIMMTQKAANISDIWRDIRHIGAEHDFSPLVLNDNAPIIDDNTGEQLIDPPHRAEVNRIVQSGEWPDEYNLVLTTYSQFQGKIHSAAKRRRMIQQGHGDPDHAKSRWLIDVADENTMVLCDEIHTAAGEYSRTSRNVRKALAKAGEKHGASATWAKNLKNMRVYEFLFPEDMDYETISEVMRKGGETLQEVLSTMLVADGVMVRREQDLSQAEFISDMDVDHRLQRNREYMDQLAPILAQMAYMSGEMDRMVNRHNGRAERQVNNLYGQDPDNENERENRTAHLRRLQMTRTHFGSPLYRISRLFKTALNVERTVELARESLRNDEKPVVVVENTMQQVLQEIKQEQEELGQETSRQPDFKDLMRRVVNQLRYAKHGRGDTARYVDLAENSPQLQQQLQDIMARIEELPEIPLSPIDSVKMALQQDGYRVEEITGRSLAYDGNRVVQRNAESRIETVTNFNAGFTDALVVNTAGCTGISLHAGARFQDTRRRTMIELQEPGDIIKQMQAYGRINRYDQVVPPKIITPSSGLPIEIRLTAMRNQKLRRMSANVIADRNSAALVDNIPDLMNSVGDRVIARYAQTNPNLMRRLGLGHMIEQDENENIDPERMSEETIDQQRFGNTFLSRLIMLPTDEQERVINEIDAEFTAHVEELNAMGNNPLNARYMEGEVETLEESVFEGADVDNPSTVFAEPVTLRKVRRTREVTPFRARDLTAEVAKGEQRIGANGPDTFATRLRQRYWGIIGFNVPEGIHSADDAETAGMQYLANRMRRLDNLISTLDRIRPGSEILFTNVDDQQSAIVTDVKMPWADHMHLPAHYEVYYVVPGDTKPRTARLETLLRDSEFAVLPGLEGDDYEGIIQRFENSLEGSVSEERSILGGNLFNAVQMAMENKLGSVVAYRDENGVRNRGVLVSKRAEELYALPVRLTSPDMVIAAVAQKGARITSDQNFGSSGVVIFRPQNARQGYPVRVSLPRRNAQKWQFVYESEEVRELTRYARNPRSPAPKIDISEAQLTEDGFLGDVINRLSRAGVRFYTSGSMRDWANRWMGAQYGAQEAPEIEAEAQLAEDISPEQLDEDEAEVFASLG